MGSHFVERTVFVLDFGRIAGNPNYDMSREWASQSEITQFLTFVTPILLILQRERARGDFQ